MDDIAKVVEEISAEISGLKEHRQAARAEAERAIERLAELSGRKAMLSSGIFSGEREVAEQTVVVMEDFTKVLDEESEVLSRMKIHADEATRELDRLILEAEVRYHEAEKRLARKRYELLCQERFSLDGEAEDVLASFLEVLDRLEGLYEKQVRVAADADSPSLAYQDPRHTIENWLVRRLRGWLSLEGLEQYDAPLPELDPLALKPEPQGGSPGVGGSSTLASAEKSAGAPLTTAVPSKG